MIKKFEIMACKLRFNCNRSRILWTLKQINKQTCMDTQKNMFTPYIVHEECFVQITCKVSLQTFYSFVLFNV